MSKRIDEYMEIYRAKSQAELGMYNHDGGRLSLGRPQTIGNRWVKVGDDFWLRVDKQDEVMAQISCTCEDGLWDWGDRVFLTREAAASAVEKVHAD